MIHFHILRFPPLGNPSRPGGARTAAGAGCPLRGPRNKELRVGRTCGSGGCQVPKLSIDPRLGRGRVAPGSARRRRLGLLQAEGLGARSAGRGHGAAQAAAGRAGRASRGGGYARRRVCERAGGAAPARSRPLMQLRHRFQGSCNPIPSDSQALSDSSDLVHPREGGERERKKAPTVCPSWHPIDFLEEGPIPAWRPARVEEPPTPAQRSPRYSHGRAGSPCPERVPAAKRAVLPRRRRGAGRANLHLFPFNVPNLDLELKK
ncbi:uncharacterized protein RBU33_011294 [Hipposideros larvatus]